MKLRKYTQEQLIEAVKTSFSYCQTLNKLNVVAAGGNYEVLKKAIKYFDLDSSHFKGRSWNKGNKFPPKRPIEDYFTNKQSILSHKLKIRMLRDKIVEPVCTMCGLREWLGQPIPLELHHIDGSSSNNNRENLVLLCPNCHTLTPTYRKSKSAL